MLLGRWERVRRGRGRGCRGCGGARVGRIQPSSLVRVRVCCKGIASVMEVKRRVSRGTVSQQLAAGNGSRRDDGRVV